MADTERHDARNTLALARVRANMNGRIYARCCEIYNDEGRAAALEYLRRFYADGHKHVADEMFRD